MIEHVVMWKFKRGNGFDPKESAMNMKEKLESLRGQIPGLISIEVGINMVESASAYDAVLVSQFESWQALEDYKVHPLHVPISNYCKAVRESRTRVDFEK
ncbi:MAG: Dabb family protein [Bacteroidales bacterium]|nr:Dabb family protein [Bacteroidales bacterium]